MSTQKTIREWVMSLPEPYRELALKYEHDQRWDGYPDTNWDEADSFNIAFSFKESDEGRHFWPAVCNFLDGHSPSLPPLPAEKSVDYKAIFDDLKEWLESREKEKVVKAGVLLDKYPGIQEVSTWIENRLKQ